MKKLLLALLPLLLASTVSAQDMTQYRAHIKVADQQYEDQNYQASADAFKAAFETLDGKAQPNDRYNAACSYALAGDGESAFYHLFYLCRTSKYKNLDHITTDPDLNSLHQDDQWEELIAFVRANKEEAEKNLDKELVAVLNEIYKTDQGYRLEISGIEEEYGRDSEEMRAQWKKISHADSINTIKVCEILDERGWLGADVVGDKGNTVLFLVIQHADLEVQEKYLPMMREAVKAGNARSSSLALLEDRVAMRNGKRQVYGSQIGMDPDTGEYYLFPLEDPERVDERRASVGLGPIADYISNWELEWDVEAHKKMTAEREAKEKSEE